MIASFSNDFIFLKTRNTASTSVEMILSTWCSGRDIVTPLAAADEAQRTANGGGAMNYRGGLLRRGYSSHQDGVDVRRRLPRLWASAFIFTVERHPYERAVSRAYGNIHGRGGDPAEFPVEIERVLNVGDLSNRNIYCIDDEIVVDEVVLYDQLWLRMAGIARSFGRTLPSEPPRARSGYRSDRRPAREILSAAQRERVFQLTVVDFATFGFER